MEICEVWIKAEDVGVAYVQTQASAIRAGGMTFNSANGFHIVFYGEKMVNSPPYFCELNNNM